jgi:competence protein ComEA
MIHRACLSGLKLFQSNFLSMMKDRIFYWLKSYLGFSKREAKGFVMVLPVLLILYAIPLFLKRMAQQQTSQIEQAYHLQVEQFLAQEVKPENSKANQILVSDTVRQMKEKSSPVWQRPKQPSVNSIPLSEVDSISLQVVAGIGETLAGRIVKYRENLGGFIRQEQLLEVYGITEEVAKRVVEQFPFSPKITNKLKINEMELAELSRHPYISYGEAKVVLAYRKQHGYFQSPEDLLQVKILNADWLDRLRPYLEF